MGRDYSIRLPLLNGAIDKASLNFYRKSVRINYTYISRKLFSSSKFIRLISCGPYV